MRERLLLLDALAHFLVVAGEVAHRDRRHELVAPLHLGHAPVERARGLPHVGDHRRQQVRDALVHRELEHLGIDHDHAHFGRCRLVEHRQDHRVDRHRLARAGRARDQQVRHPRQVRDHRLAGDVLAQRDRDLRVHVGVGLGAHDLRQAHDLALRIGNLQPHARRSGNRLDDADRHHRERAGQVAREVHDLRALHAHGGLDLVARDDRPRIGGDHLHLHAEVEELSLDQARGVFEGLRGGPLDVRIGRVQQRERRKRRVRQLREERHLLLAHDALALGHVRGRHLDADGLVVLELLLRLLDLALAQLGREAAFLPVAAGLDARAHGGVEPLHPGAEPLGKAQPRQPREDAQGGGQQREQHQGAAGESERGAHETGEDHAEHAARRAGQRRRERVQAHRLERAARGQQQREAGEGHGEGAAAHDLPRLHAPIEAQDAVDRERHPPPRRKAEEIEQRLGDPRAGDAALVGDRLAAAAEERSRVAAAVGGEDERQPRADAEEEDPSGLAQGAADSRVGGVRGGSYSDGGNSLLMIVIDFDSIEMKPRSERSLRIRFTISRDAPTMLARSCCESFSPTMSLPLL